MTQTAEKVMDRKQLQKHWSTSIDFLDNNFAYFLTHVLHIGRPFWTDAIPTAAVQMSLNDSIVGKLKNRREDYDFDFLFAPKFATKLSTSAMAFILAHETMHIVLNHLKLVETFVKRESAKKLIEKKRNGERLTRDEIKQLIVEQQNARRFNIAADCVINDYLVNSGMDDSAFYNTPGSPMYSPNVPEGTAMLCRGVDKIGESAAFMTVYDVYERLQEEEQEQKKKRQQQQSGGGSGTPDPDSDGDESDDMDGRGDQAIDSHDWMLDPDYADELADAIDKMNEEIEKAGKMPSDLLDKKDEEDGKQTAASQQLSKSMRAGSEEGNMSEFMGTTGAKLGWVKLLKQLDPDMFKEPAIAPPPVAQWHKRPRKLGGMPSNIILPVREKAQREKVAREKPAIVLALDVSGSIGPRDADRFIELAKSIPTDRIKLFTCTFDTQYMKVDMQNDTNFRIGGGTHFDSIPNFINDHVKPELKGKYPKAVVVITDGMAPLSQNLWPTEQEAEGWYWLISPTDGASSHYPASKQIGRRDRLEQYVV